MTIPLQTHERQSARRSILAGLSGVTRLSPPAGLSKRVSPWGWAAILALTALTLLGFWLRVQQLSAEGLADDEVYKWLAANRYLHGDFGGFDVEHPMLMKGLIALTALFAPASWAPETITRFPNAVAGAASIWVIALLGRRLFGRAAGLFAAALAAVSTTYVGYQRVAKEDTLLGLFLMVMLWCIAEARAAAEEDRTRDQRRFELWGAISLGAMFASKYFLFFAPIPVVAYAWLRASGARWHVPTRRWLQLIGVAFVVFSALNWTPFMPSTWSYLRHHMAGEHVVTASMFFMGRIYDNVPFHLREGMPPSFYFILPLVKFTPALFLTAAAGIGLAVWRREPADRIALTWLVLWYVVWLLCGGKYARYFVTILPAFLLFAAHASVEAVRFLMSSLSWRVGTLRPMRAAAGFALSPALVLALALPASLVGAETAISLRLAPHYRLYINALGGGDARVNWFFPHCDYFDAGFREAIQYVAAHAERGAEVSTEIDLPAKLYAERAGRPDLVQTLVRRDTACKSNRPCYVVFQAGRLYRTNAEAVGHLAPRQPWHVERIRGLEAVTVYRLEPGESPFPIESSAA